MTRIRAAVIALLGLMFPISAFAEVSDKMASQGWLGGQGILLGNAGAPQVRQFIMHIRRAWAAQRAAAEPQR